MWGRGGGVAGGETRCRILEKRMCDLGVFSTCRCNRWPFAPLMRGVTDQPMLKVPFFALRLICGRRTMRQETRGYC